MLRSPRKNTDATAYDTVRIRAFTPVFDRLWRNPGAAFPDFASLHPGYRRVSSTFHAAVQYILFAMRQLIVRPHISAHI
jgi:hypothetical protein